MSTRSEVLLWAQRTVAKKDAPANQVLDLPSAATIDHAQVAFHKLARTAHPDLHRTSLSPEELELVTRAYSLAAAAYQSYRVHAAASAPAAATAPRPASAPAAPPPSAPAGVGPTAQMNGKALLYYRKAELALRRGDFTAAILQMKMAIAADPRSAFLRTALAEVQAELAKT